MGWLILLPCLHGFCAMGSTFTQVPAPWIHPGASESGWETYRLPNGQTVTFVPLERNA